MSPLVATEAPPLPEFTPFPKIGRLNKDMVVTEKLDGTNAAVGITEDGNVYAQSRKQIITPEKDNFNFAAWVAEHEEELIKLGPGVHFGEWWGSGIQRGYDLREKRFSLFNTGRWNSELNKYVTDPYAYIKDDGEEAVEGLDLRGETHCIECPVCHVVPLLAVHTFDTGLIQAIYTQLKFRGSVAAPGFENPEGVVVFHTARGTLFKLSDAKVPPPEHDRSAAQL